MKELAEYLISERKNRNLSLKTVAERSGVSANMLRCFEACDFECLGASLIVRKTIRGYCEALEIDPEPLLQKYSSRIDTFRFQERGLLKYAKQMKLFRQKRRMIGFPLFLFALATAAIMYGGVWVSEKRAKLSAPPALDQISTQEELPAELRQKLSSAGANDLLASGPSAGKPAAVGTKAMGAGVDSRETAKAFREADKAISDADKNINDAQKAKEAGRVRESVKAEIEPAKPDTPNIEVAFEERGWESGPAGRMAISNSIEAVAGDRPAILPDSGKVYRFSIEADHKTWVKVILDDKETRSAMLYPGDKREWTAKKGITVVVGNAGGVHMKWDDQQVKAPREPGRVLKFRLPDQLASLGN